MKNRIFHFTFFASILFLLLICQSNSLLAAGPTLLPEQHFYDVKYYVLDLWVDPDTRFIQGYVKIGGEVVQDATSQILLNFYDHMTVDSVQMSGQPLSFTRGADILTIDLPQPLNTGDSFTLQVFYNGYPMQAGLPGYGLIFTSYNGQKLVYSYNWPYYACTWFPCKDHPSDKADSVSLTFTVPDNYHVACNGKLISTNALPNNLIQFKWVTHYPIVSYNISVNIYPFDVVHSSYTSTTSGTFPLEFFLFPTHTPTAQPQLEWIVPRIQEVYEHRYGAFPFASEKYGICESVISGGMEHQTLLIMNYPSFFSDIVVHESAHEYFGNMISIADWGHIWLNEGFATYSEAVYQEYWNGESAYQQEISQNMAGSGEGAIFVYDPSTPGNIIPYSLVYLKASVVLHMLRYVMGDSLFFQMLHDYVTVSPFRFKNIDTGQFRQFCESYYGSDLGWFFNQWIYKDGKMAADFYNYWGVQGDTLYFKIRSKPSTPTSSTYHAMPVPLRISAFMSQFTDTLWIDSLGVSTFYLFPDTTDLQIEFDPENKILKGAFDQKSFPEIDSLIVAGDSIGVFWQPFFDFTQYLLKVYFEQNGVWQLVWTAVAQGNHCFYRPQQAGTYGFSLAAQQHVHITRFSPLKTTLYTNFPMNQGVLIVDETRNSTGGNMWNPTDAEVDAFYDSLFSGMPHQQFDILAENRPLTVLDLAPYGLVVWHHDVPNNSFLSQSQSALAAYLRAGGKIIFSGLKIINSLTPDFSSRYLGI
ncbi:MAG TPA: M1 family peptidase, partial [Caldithrix sp.]|nr:M1 family peptidase [Caldithrix sp.]